MEDHAAPARTGPGGPTAAPACHAPFTSLYLDQRGFARVCAANVGPPLGNLAHQTLHEVWHGPVAQQLRQDFWDGRWGDGCDTCAWQSQDTGPEHAFARIYDLLPMPEDEPPWPTHLELALGNRCNLRCVMCSGDQSSSIRRHREGFEPLPDAYPDRFFEELAEVLPGLRRARFLGGEPFLVAAHHRVWDLAIELGLDLPIHVTTNGTIWNDRVEHVLEHLPTSLAISMDGLQPETISRVRVGADPVRLLRNLDRFQAHAERRGTYIALTYCLMTVNWEELGEFLAFAAARGLDVYVNTVMSPSRLSLYRLPIAELAEVVRSLDEQDAHVRPVLGQNVGIWDDQRTRLRARLEAADAVPRWLRTVDDRVDAVPVGSPRSAKGTATAKVDGDEVDDLAVLTEWADGGPVASVELDEADRVVRVEPDRPTFLHLPSDVRHSTLDDITVLLVSFYGRRTAQEVLDGTSGVEDVRWRCETTNGRTDLRSRMRRTTLRDGRDGLRVVMAARPSVTR